MHLGDLVIKIILSNPRGFCAGVNRALNIVQQALSIYDAPIYVRHALVHNDYLITQLSDQGVIFIEDISIVPDGSVVIFSAHGVSKKVKEQAKIKNLIVFDATCPLVMKVHMEVIRASRAGMEVILIGHFGHPEVEGTLGQYISAHSSKKIYLVESELDAWLVDVNCPDNLFFVTQTTLSVNDTKRIVDILYKRFPNIQGPRTNDICYATFNRQDALKKLSTMVEIIFIIGSKSSSNSNRLLELAHYMKKPAYLIDNVNNVHKDWLYGIHIIGITAGASVPEVLVSKMVEKLSLFSEDHVIVEEMFGKKENMIFNIPKSLIV